MNLFNKIKINYNSNYIVDQLKNNNLSDIKDFLENMSKKNKKVFLDLSMLIIFFKSRLFG